MKLKFNPNQPYQLDAIRAVVDIFAGQPLKQGDFEIEMKAPEGHLELQGEFAVGNRLQLSEEAILKNVRKIQKRNDLADKNNCGGFKHGLNFSIEMETGTGKTYVYLRTIHELHRKYGFRKFIIVVPSIAIKEGVIKNLEITKDHFSSLYGNPEMDFYVYDPRKRGQLKTFATNNSLQILVINIDSFAKFSQAKNGKNVIYQSSDWGVPIRYIQGVRPIVIVDEPQNMETEIRKKAIRNLNPLCTLRYSATHKNLYNLVYKLDPVKAYDLNLVKKIEVDSVTEEGGYNNAYIHLKSVQAKGKKVSARLTIDCAQKNGVKRKVVTVQVGDDLYKSSGEREIYKQGFEVNEIDVQGESISFGNGLALYVGQAHGEMTDQLMKCQIRKTVENHFEKELHLRERGLKVLSLFFIDRVANYRQYENGNVKKGKIAQWFEESFEEIRKNPKYNKLITDSVDSVHNGYFSKDKKGILKDTKGVSQADDETYTLIMKSKEKLLAIENPLRFIFSHSALREGWDNPNVFQICTLNETKSDMKKRQEIGRGMRLPVNQHGERVQDESLNILTVTANEAYEDFAKSLQKELADDCGVDFRGRIKEKRQRNTVKLKKGYELDENFKEIWKKIKQKTRYKVRYETEELVYEAVKILREVKVSEPKIVSYKARLDINKEEVSADLVRPSEQRIKGVIKKIPDILGYIQNRTKLTRHTILRIIKKANKFDEILKNPQMFLDLAVSAIKTAMKDLMINGIKYEKIAGEFWEMREFGDDELTGYLLPKDATQVTEGSLIKAADQEKNIYDHIKVDSGIEKTFAEDLEKREDVKLFFKLPAWFTVDTPVGKYNPDWAIVFEGIKKVYFVAETKGTDNVEELAKQEKIKIECGRRHFEQIDEVEFRAPVKNASQIIT